MDTETLRKNYFRCKEEIENSSKGLCQLIVVSKTRAEEEILEIYNAGHRDFGENNVQEMSRKHENLPKDIRWHLIGHLQTNKVKYIAPFVHLIHSLDSLKLAQEIQKQALKQQRKINCLVQIKIAQEESKYGMASSDLNAFLSQIQKDDFSSIKVEGLMGIATASPDSRQIQTEFQTLSQLYNEHKDFTHLSMGMTADYQIAIEQGSTMVRIGSKIFGARDYSK